MEQRSNALSKHERLYVDRDVLPSASSGYEYENGETDCSSFALDGEVDGDVSRIFDLLATFESFR